MRQQTRFSQRLMLLVLLTTASTLVDICFGLLSQRHSLSAYAQENQSTLNTESSDNSLTSLEQAVFNQINQYRASKGLSLFALNDSISAQARTHSQAMVSGQVAFGHDGFGQRVQAIATVISLSASAENVAYNQGFSDPVTQAVQGWIKSTGHRQNIEGNYDQTGIGIAKNSKGEYYFTQIFVSSLSTNKRANGTNGTNSTNNADGVNGADGANGISSTVTNSDNSSSTQLNNSFGSLATPTGN